MRLLFLLQKPAPGAAQGIVPVNVAIVMEKIQVGKALVLENAFILDTVDHQ